MPSSKIPAAFAPYLWSARLEHLDLQIHQSYIVHQLLNFGDLDAFAWLKQTYTLATLKQIFVDHPARLYTAQSFNFVAKFLLGLGDESLNKEDYVNLVS